MMLSALYFCYNSEGLFFKGEVYEITIISR